MLRVLGTGLLSMGCGLLLFVVITVVNGDPFTAIAASSAQTELEDQLNSSAFENEGSDATGKGTETTDSAVSRRDAQRYRRSVTNDQAAGRIVIPAINLRTVMVKGTSVNGLRKGPGVYPEGGFPGQGRPVAVAGHRTTYGAPFLDIDQLKNGDVIRLDFPYGRFVYRVVRIDIIEPTDWSILNIGKGFDQAIQKRVASGASCPDGNCEHLVLTACNPKYSAAQRIAVYALPA